MKNESLITISKRTGYSISTVSRALSGNAEKYRISKKAVEVILAEAKRCNYTPSLVAKSLRTNKTYTIGLVIPGIDNPYFANIAHIIIQEAGMHGYTIILIDSMENEIKEQEGISSLISRKVDGIIVVPCGPDPEMLETISQNIPVILIDRYYKESSLPYVCTNNYMGAYQATSYLIEKGHTEIACIRGKSDLTPNMERSRGYTAAMEEHGLADKIQISGEDFSIRNGYLETKLLLSRSQCPTAIFAFSNTILLGALKAIKEAGFHIPADISVLSFDNYTYLDYLDPAITRMGQPIEEIGILTIKLFLQRMESSGEKHTKIELPPTLIERNSVSFPKQVK